MGTSHADEWASGGVQMFVSSIAWEGFGLSRNFIGALPLKSRRPLSKLGHQVKGQVYCGHILKINSKHYIIPLAKICRFGNLFSAWHTAHSEHSANLIVCTIVSSCKQLLYNDALLMYTEVYYLRCSNYLSYWRSFLPENTQFPTLRSKIKTACKSIWMCQVSWLKH